MLSLFAFACDLLKYINVFWVTNHTLQNPLSDPYGRNCCGDEENNVFVCGEWRWHAWSTSTSSNQSSIIVRMCCLSMCINVNHNLENDIMFLLPRMCMPAVVSNLNLPSSLNKFMFCRWKYF